MAQNAAHMLRAKLHSKTVHQNAAQQPEISNRLDIGTLLGFRLQVCLSCLISVSPVVHCGFFTPSLIRLSIGLLCTAQLAFNDA